MKTSEPAAEAQNAATVSVESESVIDQILKYAPKFYPFYKIYL